MTSDAASEKSQSSGARSSSHFNPRQRILVVDDEADIRRFNLEVLGGCGYSVDTAADGAIAWNSLQLNDYDLLITDNKMPKLTGVELLEKMHAVCLRIPVIMASGTMPSPELSLHPRLRIDTVLLKPYTAEELLAAVSGLLQATNSVPSQRALLSESQTTNR